MATQNTLSDACTPAVSPEARVLVLGDDAHGVARDCWPHAALSHTDAGTRYELAVVFESCEASAHDLPTLAAARDQWANQVLVLTPLAAVTTATQTVFLGLGFSRRPLPEPQRSLYVAHGYAISNYKPTPDWLNNRFWANPGRWNKN